MCVIFSTNVSRWLLFFICTKKDDKKNMCRARIKTEKVPEVVFVFGVQVILW